MSNYCFLHVYRVINMEAIKYCIVVEVLNMCICIEYKPKGCFVSGRFVPSDVFFYMFVCLQIFSPPNVLSPRTFGLLEVLSFWMFCPS
jgi:hypothetical protein